MIIDRYISAEIRRPFVVSAGLLLVVFVAYSAIVRLAEVEQGVLPLMAALLLIALKSIVGLEIILPTALYLSVIAALGRLAADSEIVALYATGISELRILESVLRFALVVALAVALLSLFGRPWAYRQSYRVEAEATRNSVRLEAGRFLSVGDGAGVLFARRVRKETGQLFDLFLQREQGERINVVHARAGRLLTAGPGVGRVLELHDGRSYLLDPKGSRDAILRFRRLAIALRDPAREAGRRRKAESTLRLSGSGRRRDVAEFQWRLCLPLVTLLLAALAVPFGRQRPRGSRYRSYLAAIALYVVLFNAMLLARNLVEQGFVGPLPGIWWVLSLPLLILLILYRVPRGRR